MQKSNSIFKKKEYGKIHYLKKYGNHEVTAVPKNNFAGRNAIYIRRDAWRCVSVI